MYLLRYAGTLAVGAAVGLSAPVGAEPTEPAAPTVAAPPLSQNELLLPQNAAPSLPGTDPGTPPPLNPLNNGYLLPQYTEPSAPGQGQIVGVEPGQEDADVSKRDYLHRLWDTYRAGGLEGGLLGQRDQDPAGRPVPVVPPAPVPLLPVAPQA